MFSFLKEYKLREELFEGKGIEEVGLMDKSNEISPSFLCALS
jgi:hypothetical protein